MSTVLSMTATGTRARVRAELTREITEVARTHLATSGAAALSLRAVARELGMASSAVYRYFPSRDDLLTALIVDAYDALGATAEAADAAAGPDGRARWLAVCRSVREWALAHPHEYALVYGSPVPGYAAPETTIGPAGRVGVVLCRIMVDGGIDADESAATDVMEPGVAESLGLPPALGEQAIRAWTALFGLINFELFGHTHNVVRDHAAYFDRAVLHLAEQVGLRRRG
jgi:AcrR family transcriptional regulator